MRALLRWFGYPPGMDPKDRMPVDLEPAALWTLSKDCTEVRLALPPIALEGLAKPLELFVDFDAKAVDQILARLSVLRVKMRRPEMPRRPPAKTSAPLRSRK